MAVIWGSIGLIVREVDQPAVVIVWYRVVIASLALAAVRGWRARREARWRDATAPHPRSAPMFAVRGVRLALQGVVLAAHWVLLFAALRRAPIGTVVLLTYTAPLLVAAVAPTMLREAVRVRTLVALACGFGGTALVLQPSADGSLVGPLYALGAAVLLAVLILNAKLLSEDYDGLTMTLAEVAVAAVVLTPPALVAADRLPSATELGWLVVLGLVHTAATLTVYLSCIARLRATHISILGYLEPASAALLGWWVLDETMSGVALLGAVGIVVGGLLVGTDSEDDAAVTTTPMDTDVPR